MFTIENLKILLDKTIINTKNFLNIEIERIAPELLVGPPEPLSTSFLREKRELQREYWGLDYRPKPMQTRPWIDMAGITLTPGFGGLTHFVIKLSVVSLILLAV